MCLSAADTFSEPSQNSNKELSVKTVNDFFPKGTRTKSNFSIIEQNNRNKFMNQNILIIYRLYRFLLILPVNPFHASVAFHIETSYLICRANQMTGFYMKCNTEFFICKQKLWPQSFYSNYVPLYSLSAILSTPTKHLLIASFMAIKKLRAL